MIIKRRATLPHLITTNDLFCNFDMKKLTGEGNIKRAHHCADKKSLAKRILLQYLYVMFEDLVQGGKTFMLPSRRYGELKIRRIPDILFKRTRQKGYHQDIDVIQSGMVGYEPILVYKSYGRIVNTPVRLSAHFKEILLEKTNSGFKYC